MPSYPDVFDPASVEAQIRRLDALTPESRPLWGKMDAAAMLAHLNVSYEMLYDGNHPRPNAIMRWLLRGFVKQGVVGPAPYKRNTPTAPAFRIQGARDFAREKARLQAYMRRVSGEGTTCGSSASSGARPAPRPSCARR
mgnify:CR=1 FL=1